MKVLLTGATSFTGAHIARALVDAGFEVAGTLTKRMPEYSDPLVQQRRGYGRVIEWIESAPIGSPRFLEAVKTVRPDVFINHGADIRNYRSPDFNYLASVSSSLLGAREVCDALAAAGCRRFIHSGSVFEPDEGEAAFATKPAAEAISIYGVSKAMVWEPYRFFAAKAGLPVTKIVIADPIGPLENADRLVPAFVAAWKSGKVPRLTTPTLLRDRVPAPWLARVYAEEARRDAPDKPAVRARRPSAYALTNEAFLKLVVEKFSARAKRSLPIDIAPTPTTEPHKRINTEVLPELKNTLAEDAFWERWGESLWG